MIVITLFLIGGMGCAKEDSTLTNTNHLGVSFFIKTQEVKSLILFNPSNNSSDSRLSVSFEKVIYDSRCPKSECYLCYGSTATIQILLTHQNTQSSIYLIILGCHDEYKCDDNLYYRKDTLGYRICLIRLDPYPTGKPINSQNYTAKLNISKL
ncbi:MAG: hypothetical protein P4L34_02295 [Paludibacter sp.]|nr:hypothetical protein [Paludibacter sp.]